MVPYYYLVFILLILILFSVACVCLFVRKRFQYWKKRSVPFVNPSSLVFGNCTDFILGKITCDEYSLYLYKELGDHKFGGFFNFHRPCLLIKDPLLIKRILVQDSQYFPHRSPHYIPKDNPLQNNLLQMTRNSSKDARKKLTPGFSLSRMKSMFNQTEAYATELFKIINHSIETKESINMKNLLARYFMDISSSWLFGLEANALHEPDSDFVNMGRKFFESRFASALSITWPFLAHRILRFKRIPEQTVSFYDRIIKNEILYRDENGIFKNDVLNIMMNLRKQVLSKNGTSQESGSSLEFNNDFISAQSIFFFTAGYDGPSSLVTFALLELTRNPIIKRKVQMEIDDCIKKYNNQITYEMLNDLPYTNQNFIVVNYPNLETLRKYPVVTFLVRTCAQSYTIPNTKIIIEKGTGVFVPLHGLHNDPKYFVYPDRFYPDHFLQNGNDLPPGVFLPFGDGPRGCIANRLGFLQIKVGLVTLLRYYDFHRASKTKLPLKFRKHTFFSSCETEIWFDCSRRKEVPVVSSD